MAKNVKKNLRMRKQIRKTMGIICLITAIVVAAIPVPEASAEEGTTVNRVRGQKYTWDDEIWKGGGENKKTSSPVVPKDCKEIYTTGDGTFQFAYVYWLNPNICI